jgi:LPS export ABC transporter protein LptC
MARSHYLKSKKLKIVLLSATLIAVGIVIAVYLGYQRLSDAPELLWSTIQEGADMSIGKIHQTATRDGKKEWSLEAASAHYMQDKNQVILNELTVIFYLDDGSEAHLTAERGKLNTTSKDIEVSGNVVIIKDTYRLTTEKLNYVNENRMIHARVPVLVTGEDAEVSANSASFDLNTKKIRLKGNVESKISGKKAM